MTARQSHDAGEALMFGQRVLLLEREAFVVELANRARRARTAEFISNLNVHALACLRRHEEFRAAYSMAAASHIDGAPLVPLFRAAGLPARMSHRHTFVDFTHLLLERAVTDDMGVAFVGGRPDRTEGLRSAVLGRHPGLNLLTQHGYFDDAAHERRVVEQLNIFAPRIVIVGMGMPRQEEWIAAHLRSLPPGIVLNGGGILDLLSGDRWVPPRWTGRIGIESIARLLRYPGTWRRYLLEPIPVVPFAAREVVAVRRWRRSPV